MAQTLETGLIINGLTGDANTLLISGPTPESVFVVRNSGNVGIGITNPTEKLEVSGKTKTETIQITSGVTNIGSVLTAVDSQGNTEWGQFINVTSLSATTPMSATNVNSPVISIQDAKADDITKGAASFNSSDFNDNNNGLISIDYVNAQKASGTTDGFLSSIDWNTFNNKQNDITLSTNGTFQPSTFDSITGNLNIPTYGGPVGSGIGYNLVFGFNSSTVIPSNILVFGPNLGGTWLTIFNNRNSRFNRVIKNSTLKNASVMIEISNYAGTTTASTIDLIVKNDTTNAEYIIDSNYPINNATNNGWTGTPPSRVSFHTFNPPVTVNQGDKLQIRFSPKGWTSDVIIYTMVIYLFFE